MNQFNELSELCHVVSCSGLMKDHGQQARASDNFAGPVDFETPRPDLPVHLLNFQKPWLSRTYESLEMYWQIWPWCFKIYRPGKIFTGPGLLAVVFHKPWI